MYYLKKWYRNKTALDGLQGDLGSENAFELEDPSQEHTLPLILGWGPKDERVWITARRPMYKRFNIWIRPVGQKIDGALHDGGNDRLF